VIFHEPPAGSIRDTSASVNRPARPLAFAPPHCPRPPPAAAARAWHAATLLMLWWPYACATRAAGGDAGGSGGATGDPGAGGSQAGAGGQMGGGGGSGGTAGATGATAGRGAGGSSDAGADLRPEAGETGGAASSAYDLAVLADHPVGYWAMNRPQGTEPDLTGNGSAGSYRGGPPALVDLPNGDRAADFDGARQYLTIPSRASYSIPTTGNLTWEGWIRPDVLQFPNDGGGGYVDWLGKCAEYAPTCEWEARMYDTTNAQNRCNRLSAYVFNPGAGLGSGADWQPTCGLFQPGQWHHVVGEYTTLSQPAACPAAATYPGSINIWVDGIAWSQAAHNPTGCMGQYNVTPVANGSPINVGSMAQDTWFAGAVGKLAIYDYLLSPSQVTAHYRTMTGQAPSGSCGNTCTSSR